MESFLQFLQLTQQIQVYISLVKFPITLGTLIIILFNNRSIERLIEQRKFIASVVLMLYISVASVLGIAAD